MISFDPVVAVLRQVVTATGSGLMDVYGIGPAGAARILADVGDVARFADRDPVRLLDWHRRDRRVLRRADPPPAVSSRQPAAQPRALHRRGLPDPSRHPRPSVLPAQARRRQDASTGGPAVPTPATVRCGLPATRRRRRSHRHHDRGDRERGPGRALGATTSSSAVDSNPGIGASEKSLPGPAATTLPPPRTASRRPPQVLDTEGSRCGRPTATRP